MNMGRQQEMKGQSWLSSNSLYVTRDDDKRNFKKAKHMQSMSATEENVEIQNVKLIKTSEIPI